MIISIKDHHYLYILYYCVNLINNIFYSSMRSSILLKYLIKIINLKYFIYNHTCKTSIYLLIFLFCFYGLYTELKLKIKVKIFKLTFIYDSFIKLFNFYVFIRCTMDCDILVISNCITFGLDVFQC